MSKIEVTRIIKYVFDDFAQFDRHFANSAVPLNGAVRFGNLIVRSTALVSPYENNNGTGEEDDYDSNT